MSKKYLEMKFYENDIHIKIQVKINVKGVKWENIYQHEIYMPDNEDLINLCCQIIADIFHEQVRWNYPGSTQGHYVSNRTIPF